MKQILSENYAIIGADIISHPTTIFTDDDVPVEIFDTEEQLVTYIAGMQSGMFPPIPEVGEWCEENKIYAYGSDKAKCLQSHNRMHYPIEDTPALWLVIPTVQGYPVWQQPTGAHDSYQIGDIVHYPNIDSPLWKCVAGDGSGNNIWAPGVYGWILFTP